MDKIMYRGQELLPPKMDIVFKALFGAEGSKDILASFLNAILDMDIKDPEDIELLNTEIGKNHKNDKLSRLDIRVKAEGGEHIDIEIQVENEYDIIKRGIYYTALLYTDQMKESMEYRDIGRTISLLILDFDLLKEKEYLNSYRLINRNSNKELTDVFEVNFLELKKMPKEIKNKKDMWASFLGAKSEEELDMLADMEVSVREALNKLEYVSTDEKMKYEYDMRRKALLDHYNSMKTAERKGKLEGKLEGKLDVARNMLTKGYNIVDIADITGLSIEEVRKLIN